jgi:hypothetical protein
LYPNNIVYLSNSLIAGNMDNSGKAPDLSGVITSTGYNLIQSTQGATLFSATGDITGTAPILSPLQNNCGTTLTHALLPGSPGLNAGNPVAPGSVGNACETADQRGVARPQDGICDIGAYEFNLLERLFLPFVKR